jgi:hypothetical protein
MGFLQWIKKAGKSVGNFFVKAGKMALKVFRGALKFAKKAIPVASALIGVAKKIPGLGSLASEADVLLRQVKKGVKVADDVNKGLGQIGV